MDFIEFAYEGELPKCPYCGAEPKVFKDTTSVPLFMLKGHKPDCRRAETPGIASFSLNRLFADWQKED